jgi:hypothetical protein
MTTITQTIPSLGSPPLTTDPANFDTRADTLYGTSLPAVITATNTWSGQANTVAGEVNTNATTATTARIAAEAAEAAAEAAQAAAQSASNATKWVSGQAYVAGNVVWSPSNYLSYRAVGATSGTTDPSQSASWVLLAVDVRRFTNPLAQAVSVQMTASTTVGGVQQLSGVNNNLGAGDFTLVQTDTFKNTGQHILMGKRQTNDDVWYWYINSAGNISFLATVGGVQILNINGGAITAYYNKRTTFSLSVTRETATAAGAWAIYIDGVLFASGAIASAATVSLDNTGTLYVNARTTGSSVATTRTDSDLQAARLFNRALTAAEVLDLSINGVALADRGASQTELSSGAWLNTFTTSFDTFASAGASAFTASDATTKTGIRVYVAAPVKTGKNYRIEFTPTFTNATLASITASTGTGSALGFTPALTAPAIVSGQKYIVEVAGPSADRANILFTINTGAGGGSFAITDFSVKQIGLTSELLASNAQSNTGQIFDTSGNKNHALLPASGATVVGSPEAIPHEVRWTNTWAGTNELQYIGGVNQAILPANAYIESIIGTVSGATPHDIIVGNGSDTDRYVTITTGLAAGTTSFTLASRTTDGTNLKLTADPDTDCTMSIAWVIKYTTLES